MHIYVYIQVPNIRRPICESATKEGCRRKAVCRHTCTATPECKSIDIYVVQTSKLEKLSHLREGVLQIYKFVTGFASPQPFQGTVHNKIQ